MAALTAIAIGTAVVGGALSMIQAGEASDAALLKGQYEKNQYDMNQKLADVQATDATTRGERDVSIYATKTRGLLGQQRVAAAANGVDVNYGSAAEVQADTMAQAGVNQNLIRNNAWREALGYKIQASNYGTASTFAGFAGQNNANNTLLTGYANAAKSGLQAGWYGRNLFSGGTATKTANGAVDELYSGGKDADTYAALG